MDCTCQAWKESEPQIMGAQQLAWTNGQVYTGSPFRFCPWCGNELEKPAEAWDDSMTEDMIAKAQ